MATLNLNHRNVQGPPPALVVSIAGEVERSNGPQVADYFNKTVESEKPRHVLLDLSGVTFGDTEFFSFLLFCKEEIGKKGGALVLFGLRPEIASTMRIFALDRVLTVRPDEAAAVAALPKG